MKTIGIVSEYNPFHKGHEHHIAMSRRQLSDTAPVVCVMSGDFVQRGEAAIYNKFARAEAACRSGADLVLELPLPWALSSAEGFARGAVGLLNQLGVSHLSFGSESGDLGPLEQIAEALLDPTVTGDVKNLMEREGNLSFPAARQRILEDRLGEVAGQLELPNNILAVEYLKAIYEQRAQIQPMTVLRFGSGHDQSGGDGPRSASELRRDIRNGKNVEEFMPEGAARVYRIEREHGRELSDRNLQELSILSRLRMLDETAFRRLPDGGDGLGLRLYGAVQEEATLDAVLAAAKSKRYPLARIRRMCMCACLGIGAGMNEGLPPYARVLAANGRGCELLRYFGERTSIPLLTKAASVRELSPECVQLFSLGAKAHDFYVLSYRSVQERRGGQDWRSSPRILKER